MRKVETEENKLKIIRGMIQDLTGAIDGNYRGSFSIYEKAASAGMLKLECSIMQNISCYFVHSDDSVKQTLEYKDAMDLYRELLLELVHSDSESKVKFYNIRMIDILMERKLNPNEQLSLTKMVFNSENGMVNNKEFLHEQCKKIMQGSTDFRIISNLDALTNMAPSYFFEDEIYNKMIDYLINTYLVDYDKYEKNEFNEMIVRLIYHSVNRGYINLSKENIEKIAYCFMYNSWFSMLKMFIKKIGNKVSPLELDDLKEQLLNAFNDRIMNETIDTEEYLRMKRVLNSLSYRINKNKETQILARKG